MTKELRIHKFWNSELPLTSKRARLILSKPEASKKLAAAVRASRNKDAADDEKVIQFSKPLWDELASM